MGRYRLACRASVIASDSPVETAAASPVRASRPERVEAEAGTKARPVHPAVGGDGQEALGGRAGLRAGVQHDGDEVEHDVGEDLRQRVDGRAALAEAQPQGTRAALEVFEDLRVGRLRIGVGGARPHVPAAAVATRRPAAHERRLTGESHVRGSVGRGVERGEDDAVRQRGRQRGLGIAGRTPAALEHLGHQALPIGTRRGGELRGERQFVGGRIGVRVHVGAQACQGAGPRRPAAGVTCAVMPAPGGSRRRRTAARASRRMPRRLLVPRPCRRERRLSRLRRRGSRRSRGKPSGIWPSPPATIMSPCSTRDTMIT